MDKGLEVRARVSQEFFDFLDEYHPGLQARVRQRVSDHYLDTLASTPPNTWLPFAISCEGVEAAIEELGIERAPDLWRKAFTARFIKTPIIGGLINSWIRLFGLSPNTLVKIVPRAMEGTYRNLANVEIIDATPNSATLRMGDVAVELLDHERYFLAWHGTLQGIFDMTKTEGQVAFAFDRSTRCATFDLSWNA